MIQANWDFVIRMIIACLAAYRIGHAISFESGFLGMFDKLRYSTKGYWAEFFSCPHCNCTFAALFTVPLVLLARFPMVEFILVWLAVSGAMVIIHVNTYAKLIDDSGKGI